MSRFCWMLGAAVAVVATAWTVSAQPMLGAPRPGMQAPFPPAFQFPGGAPSALPFAPPAAPLMDFGAAQFGMPPMPPLGFREGPPGRLGFVDACLDMLAKQAGGRAYLKARLNLTPQQVLIWQEFETAATEGEQEEHQACTKASAKPDEQTLVQRMDGAEERLARRLTQMRKVGAPLRKLVAMLSPEQLRVVEQLLPPFPL